MPNDFLPQFKRSTQIALNSFRDETGVLLNSHQAFLDSIGKGETEVGNALHSLFKNMSAHLEKYQNDEAFQKMVQVLELVASKDTMIRKNVQDIKEGLRKDTASARKLLFDLLKQNEFAKYIARLFLTQEEKIAEESKNVQKEFADINNTLVGRSIYSEYGTIGVQLVSLIHAAIRIQAVKMGHDILPLPTKEHGGQSMLIPGGKERPPMPVTL